MQLLLSNSCLVMTAVAEQQQEDSSRNHVTALFAVCLRVFKIFLDRNNIRAQMLREIYLPQVTD